MLTRVADHAQRVFLRIFVNDHRGGAAGGLALARRSQRNNRGSALGTELQAIVTDLAEDAATLTELARRETFAVAVVEFELRDRVPRGRLRRARTASFRSTRLADSLSPGSRT